MGAAFKPFYWINIAKTEKYLSESSRNGRHLAGLNFLTGVFKFTEGEPAEKTYIIRRSRGCGGSAPRKMLSEGWSVICGNKNNYAAVFDGKSDTVPSCKDYRLQVSILKMLFAFVMCYTIGFMLGMTAACIDRRSLPEDDPKYVSSVGEYAKDHFTNICLHLLLTAASAAGIAVTVKSGRAYDSMSGIEGSIDFTIPRGNFIYTKEEEKRLKKEKKLIAKTKLGWFYSPDKAEIFVEDMEAKGWNFYRFDKFGKTFYFIKGEKRKVRFVVDYQNYISDEYLQSNIECGWKLQFKSATKITGYVIWLKEYDGDEPPEFYSDGESMVKYARRTAVTYILCFIPLILFAAYVIIREFFAGDIEIDTFDYFLIGLYVTVICEYVIFLSMSVGFYLRTKKKYQKYK